MSSSRVSGVIWATVALLAEGVDRNASVDDLNAYLAASPSSQRAWIEMSM